MIDTAKITSRRDVRFNSIDDALRDADRLAQLERDGRLEQLGNWTLGQSLAHLATWCEFAFTGTPLKPPFLIKLILRPMKRRFLRGPMKAGVRIPKVENGTLGVEPCETSIALPRLRDALTRIDAECPTLPNVIFGRMTHDEWRQLQLRHSELHLSFFREKR